MPRAATFNPRQLYIVICYFTGDTLFTSLSDFDSGENEK